MHRQSNHLAVIGLGFGDEGKGITTDYLASKNPRALITRFSGGHQAGHTVQIGETRHVFSNFGSGTLRGNPTYWSEYCTVDPEGILKEYQILTALGITNIDLFIDAKAPVTTPFEKWYNQKYSDNQHGTCGVGVGQTYQREEDHFHLTFEDLFNPQIMNIRLNQIRKDYYRFKQNDDSMQDFLFAVEAIKKIAMLTYGIPDGVSKIIFEGSQGLMLDQNIGFFPNVTRSNTGSKNILSMVNLFDPFIVTRCYETRHGNGPMTGVEFPVENPFVDNIVETNVNNKFQGEFRKAMLNIDTLKYALLKDGYLWKADTTLVITCMDHMNGQWYYTFDGGRIISHTDPEYYASEIARYLNVNRVIISTSADSSSFQEIDI